MKLDIDNIKRGDQSTLYLDFALGLYAIDFCGDHIEIVLPVDVNGKLYVIDEELYINLKIKTDMRVNCNRCLKSFIYSFKSSINAKIIHEDLSKYQNDELDEDIIYYKDNILDLEELIKEHIIMNIPMKLVCDEGCQGLCVKCGIKLEEDSCNCNHIQSGENDIDPRLAELKKLLRQD